jgi:hypothetical protein
VRTSFPLACGALSRWSSAEPLLSALVMATPERHCNRRRAEDYREQPFGQEERRVHRNARSPRLSRKTASSSSNLAMRAFNCAISRAAWRFTLENPRPRRKFRKGGHKNPQTIPLFFPHLLGPYLSALGGSDG